MVSDAQKKAEAKYRKESVKQVVVRFSPREMELYEHLENQPNKMGYFKQLIKRDMERGVLATVASTGSQTGEGGSTGSA